MRVFDDDGGGATLREAIITDEALENLREFAHVMPTLQHLNVSFNSLIHLGGVEQARQLRILNVSFNAIVSLHEVATLTHLRVLKCSHNAIADLSSLAELYALQELFVHDNRIESAQLAHVQRLEQLTTLVLHPNPCTERASYITDVVRAMPWLERLDTVVVDDALRSDAQHASDRETLSTSATDCSFPMTTYRSDVDSPLLEPETLETPVELQPPVTSPSAGQRPGLVRKKTKKEIAEAFMRNFPVQDFIPPEQQQQQVIDHAVSIDASDTTDAATSTSNQQDECNGASAGAATVDETLTAQAVDASDAIATAAAALSSPSSDASVRTSSIASAVLSLPTFSSDNLLRRHAPKPRSGTDTSTKKLKRAAKSDVVIPAAIIATKFDQDELLVVYPNSSVTAVHVRRDGSALAKWPSGSVAVSVDRERNGFRVYAAHRDGAIALSLDANGVGFINYYPSGRTLLSTTSSGDGLLLSPDGTAIVRQWDATRHIRDEQLMSTDALSNEHGDADGALVCRLSDGIGVRVQLAKPATSSSSDIVAESCPIHLSVYFASVNGIRYRFTNSVNVVGCSASDACDCVFGPLAAAAAAVVASSNNSKKCESGKTAPGAHTDLLHDIRAAVASL